MKVFASKIFVNKNEGKLTVTNDGVLQQYDVDTDYYSLEPTAARTTTTGIAVQVLLDLPYMSNVSVLRSLVSEFGRPEIAKAVKKLLEDEEDSGAEFGLQMRITKEWQYLQKELNKILVNEVQAL